MRPGFRPSFSSLFAICACMMLVLVRCQASPASVGLFQSIVCFTPSRGAATCSPSTQPMRTMRMISSWTSVHRAAAANSRPATLHPRALTQPVPERIMCTSHTTPVLGHTCAGAHSRLVGDRTRQIQEIVANRSWTPP